MNNLCMLIHENSHWKHNQNLISYTCRNKDVVSEKAEASDIGFCIIERISIRLLFLLVIYLLIRGEIKMKNSYGTNGIIDFSRLWELLERRGHNKAWLRANGIHANTIVKLRKNENVTCEVLANLCHLLDCQVWEILEYKKTENTRK